MGASFRQSMAWLHTWAGVVIGSLLFVIFWMGSLAVFDREIDRWMMPSTRLAAPSAPVSLEATVRPAVERLLADGAPLWWAVALPDERMPALQLRLRHHDGGDHRHWLDPGTGAVLATPGSEGGSGFLYPFHFSLHLKWLDLGRWLVGLAGMAMLVLIVSGVVLHKKIIVDFFTFRPDKRLGRATLDLHNLSGVLVLPFHVLITLSGLIIFFATYFPSAIQAGYHGDRKAFNREVTGTYSRPPAKLPGALASLDAMVARAQQLWAQGGQAGRADYVRVWHPGDAASYVEVRRAVDDRIGRQQQAVYFDAGSGALLQREQTPPVRTVQRFLTGLHEVQFAHWPLRWLYFLAGLSGCVLIATGFLFWLESRRARHAKHGLAGVRVVEALVVGSVTGIIIATLAFLVANRLLPAGLVWFGVERAALEMGVFYLVWLASFAHAAGQAGAAWGQQAWAIAGLAVAAVTLNAMTTGDHLLRTLAQGQWGVAGMDLLLLVTAGLALVAARRCAVPRRQTGAPDPAFRTSASAEEVDHA